jgi:hypothetical protein
VSYWGEQPFIKVMTFSSLALRRRSSRRASGISKRTPGISKRTSGLAQFKELTELRRRVDMLDGGGIEVGMPLSRLGRASHFEVAPAKGATPL